MKAYSYWVSVYPIDETDNRTYWWQDRKITFTPDKQRGYASSGSFHTMKKVEGFMQNLFYSHKDVYAVAVDLRHRDRREIIFRAISVKLKGAKG